VVDPAGQELVANACAAHHPHNKTARTDGDGAKSAERPGGHGSPRTGVDRAASIAIAACDRRRAETPDGISLGVGRAHPAVPTLLGGVAQVALGLAQQGPGVAR